MHLIDRIAVALLAALCLLMLYYPVTLTSLPIKGTRVASGYDVLVLDDMEKFSDQLRIAVGHFDKYRGPGVERPEPPLSMKLGKVIKVSFALAFVSAVVVLVGVFVSDLIVSIGCMAGMGFSFAALMHILLFTADMHRFMQYEFLQIPRSGGTDPLAGVDKSVVELMAGGFNLQPGFGLYIMGAAFFLAFFCSHTHLLSRVSSFLDRRERQKGAVADKDRGKW